MEIRVQNEVKYALGILTDNALVNYLDELGLDEPVVKLYVAKRLALREGCASATAVRLLLRHGDDDLWRNKEQMSDALIEEGLRNIVDAAPESRHYVGDQETLGAFLWVTREKFRVMRPELACKVSDLMETVSRPEKGADLHPKIDLEQAAPNGLVVEIVGRPIEIRFDRPGTLLEAIAVAMFLHSGKRASADSSLAKRIEVLEFETHPPRVKVEVFKTEEEKLAKYPPAG